ncbi:MAG: hypothetical protein DMG36_22010 [Acidobacteria bacterium]|nr:MAG: hypothetical protein DMG36_22010 [Acidobacteriota bacterium]
MRTTAELQFSRNTLWPRNRQFGWNCLSQPGTRNKIETKRNLGALSLQHVAAPGECHTAQNFGPKLRRNMERESGFSIWSPFEEGA